MTASPEYGNWVTKKIIYTPGIAGLVFLGLGLLLPVFLIPAGFLLSFCAYFAYARYLASSRGGNLQDRIVELVLAHLDWNGEGRALDIGCGSAALTIKLAQNYPRARVVGIDSWGGRWEYSKGMCERNARIEKVIDRVTFQKASASSLPFADGYFDAVVSNLVFHEVRDVANKREVIREALRVVKKGGRFAFQDLFLLRRTYGDTNDLLAAIRSWGIESVEFVETRNAPFIPRLLKLPFMVGTMGVITGEK
jgi:SAM-dependent methyltransferase